MAIIHCPKCESPVSGKASHCPRCNYPLHPALCPECGKEIPGEATKCPYCAYPRRPKHPSGKNPKKKQITLILIILLSAIAAVTTGILFTQNSHETIEEEKAWKAAQDSASISVLIEFMRTYPNGKFYAAADSLMQGMKKEDDQAWERILFSSDPERFKEYLVRFPKGLYIPAAQMKIDSLDWVKATLLNSPESYTEYIRNHPQGIYREEALANTDKLNSVNLTEEEKEQIARTMTEYYAAVESGSETTVLEFFEPVISQYYTKREATKADVLEDLRRMYSSDITQIRINVNNNFTSTKDRNGSYYTSFPIDITYERDEPGEETYTSSIINATLTPNLKISAITSQKVSSLNK